MCDLRDALKQPWDFIGFHTDLHLHGERFCSLAHSNTKETEAGHSLRETAMDSTA